MRIQTDVHWYCLQNLIEKQKKKKTKLKVNIVGIIVDF